MLASGSFIRSSLSAAVLCAASMGAARAVQLSTDDAGQVLLFPVVAEGIRYDTLLSLTNRDAERPALLRLTFRDGEDGRARARLNVYLGRGDTFAAAMDGNRLVPTDDTCWQTDAESSAEGVSLGLNRPALLEVIEMATVQSGTASANLLSAPERDCAAVIQAVGNLAARDALQPPRGGIAGSTVLIDVPLGISFSLGPTALDDFRRAPLYTSVDSRHPNLNDAEPAQSVVFGRFTPGGVQAAALHSSWRHPVDAVSAVLMADTLDADFNVESGISADTDVVLTFPTRHHYQGVTEDGEREPFVTHYLRRDVNVDPIEAPGQQFLVVARNREGETVIDTLGRSKCSPLQINPYPGPLLTGSQLNLRVGADPVVPGMAAHETVQVSTPDDCFTISGTPVRELMDSGLLSMDFYPYSMTSEEGHVHRGLPVIGASLTAVSNETTTLANYGGVTLLRRDNHLVYPVATAGPESRALAVEEERIAPLVDVSRDGSLVAWSTDRALAAGDMDPDTGDPETPGRQDVYLFPSDGSEPLLATPSEPGITEDAGLYDLSPDGQALAYFVCTVREDQSCDLEIRLHDLLSGEIVAFGPPGDDVELIFSGLKIRASNGGERVAYQGIDDSAATKALFIYDRAAAESTKLVDDIKWLMDMTPDGTRVLYSTGELGVETEPDRLHLVDVATGETMPVLPPDLADRLDAPNDNLLIQDAAMSDTGRYLAFSATGGVNGFYWYDRQEYRLETLARRDPVFHLAGEMSLSADGRTVAFSHRPADVSGLPPDEYQVFVWQLGDTPRIFSLSPDGFAGNGRSQRPVLSGDGTELFYASAADNIATIGPVPDESDYPEFQLIRADVEPVSPAR